MADQVPQGTAKSKPPGKKSGEIFGLPSWLAISGGTVLVVGAYLIWRKRQLAKSSSASTNTAGIDPLTGQPYTVGTGSLAATNSSSMNGYGADALYAQLVGLQGQVGNLSNASNSVLTADNATTAADQATTAADTSTTNAANAATAAIGTIPARISVPTPAAPYLPPPPPPSPSTHYYSSDGTISLNTLAYIYHSTPAAILAASRVGQPSDVASYQRHDAGKGTYVLPVNTHWVIPQSWRS